MQTEPYYVVVVVVGVKIDLVLGLMGIVTVVGAWNESYDDNYGPSVVVDKWHRRYDG